ncbi:chloramphenicol resistance protein [Clostridium sp. HCP1S3_A12]|uniref:chloramphenicol resistance protein n=1 Tax=unclassified Clostridium TaxID=2614128 RepID=UPI003F8C5071|nr:chloramphenicol resistance protein [Clostridium sp.]
MIIDGLRTYIRKCPALRKYNKAVKVNVDYLEDKPTTYSIEEVPSDVVIQKYVDGSSKRQYVFVFASRESYSEDVIDNINNSGFYEDFAEWLEEQTNNDNLPFIGDDKEVLKIEAMTNGYAFKTDVDTARYQIQCRMIYMKK